MLQDTPLTALTESNKQRMASYLTLSYGKRILRIGPAFLASALTFPT